MLINYVLLAIFGVFSIANIINLIRGRGWLGDRMFGGVIVMLLFVLALIATIMGMDYHAFVRMIEGWFR